MNATIATSFYKFRSDFSNIARPGLHRFLDTSADLLRDEFDADRRAGYVKCYVRDLWRTLKSEQEDAELREGIEPSPPMGSPLGTPADIPPPWNAERAAAIAAEFETDVIDAEKRGATVKMMKSNPLSGIAMIGADLRRDYDLVQDALCAVSLDDQTLIDDRDRAEAFKRAESVRNLGGDENDILTCLYDFVRRTVAAKKGVPYTQRTSVIPFRRKQKPLPKTLEAIDVGRGYDWTDVDGLLGEIWDWITKTASFPNKPLATMAAYATLSAPCGGRLYSPTGLGLNLYLAMLAPSGAGKNAPLTAIGKILHAAGLTEMHQTAKAFTISGFVSDGFLNRFLILEGDPQPENENVVEETIPVPESVINADLDGRGTYPRKAHSAGHVADVRA
jgi:hypothetical protein